MPWFNRLIATLLPLVPRPLVGRVASRYIAGSTADDAVRVIRNLNQTGAMATVDVLGENVRTLAETDQAAAAYLDILDQIQRNKIDCNVSVKLTHMGLLLEPEHCRNHMRQLVERAGALGNFVRIDMEDSSVTDQTLDIFRELREAYGNVGCVIQSCLRRSRDDIKAVAEPGTNVRLCKGIYVEPEAIAYRDPEIVRQAYVDLLRLLFERGAYVGIATHDERLVYAALTLIDEFQLAPHQYEFQMLLGVTEELRRMLIGTGHRLRVYVPYGARWYAYSVRRLKENPAIAGHVLRSFVGRRS